MQFSVIWDLNGVIIDDMLFHHQTYNVVLEPLGYHMTSEDFIKRCTGGSAVDVFGQILPLIGSPIGVEEAVERKRQAYFKMTPGKMRILPGVQRLLHELSDAGIRQAVASGATQPEIEFIMKEFGIEDYFDAFVASEDVSAGKPSPEPFLTAAALLSISPAKCIVIEDGMLGVCGAKEAGMKVLAVTNTQSCEELVGADMVVDSLENVDVYVLSLLLPDGQK